MRGAAFLFVLFGSLAFGAVAEAGQVPEIDIGAACSRPDAVKTGCEDLQRALKAQLEKQSIDAALATYCSADAAYHGGGYLSFATCLERVRHEAEVRRVEQAFGPGAGTYCASRSDDSRCLDREELARLRFRDEPRADGPADLSNCAREAAADGKSYEVLMGCLNGAAAAKNKAASASPR